jgi:hypothetical protein
MPHRDRMVWIESQCIQVGLPRGGIIARGHQTPGANQRGFDHVDRPGVDCIRRAGCGGAARGSRRTAMAAGRVASVRLMSGTCRRAEFEPPSWAP